MRKCWHSCSRPAGTITSAFFPLFSGWQTDGQHRFAGLQRGSVRRARSHHHHFTDAAAIADHLRQGGAWGTSTTQDRVGLLHRLLLGHLHRAVQSASSRRHGRGLLSGSNDRLSGVISGVATSPFTGSPDSGCLFFVRARRVVGRCHRACACLSLLLMTRTVAILKCSRRDGLERTLTSPGRSETILNGTELN